MTLKMSLEKLTPECWQNNKIKISLIKTEEELIYALYDCQLDNNQKDFVNPAWFSIGKAYLNRDKNYPCIIYNELSKPIGFINFGLWQPNEDAYTWSYFIDKQYQRKGYGINAAKLAINILKKANRNMKIKLATEVNNYKAQKLYVSLGFTKFSEMDGDDLVYEL